MTFGDEAEVLDTVLGDSVYPHQSCIELPTLLDTVPHDLRSSQAVVNGEEQQPEFHDAVAEDQMRSPTAPPHYQRSPQTPVRDQEQQPEYHDAVVEDQMRSPTAAAVDTALLGQESIPLASDASGHIHMGGNEEVQHESLHQATDDLILEGNEVNITEQGLVAPRGAAEPKTSDVQRSPHPQEPSLPTESAAVEIDSCTDRHGGQDFLDEVTIHDSSTR